jgi:CRP/FNR family transcriptional regulator, cyclic AMP receptor protein
VLRPGFKPMRIICERELDADHACDARATSRPWLYPGILAYMDVSELAQVPMLAMLPQHRLEYLAENSAARRFTAGHIATHRGDPALHLIIVHEGTVSATHDTRDGARVRFETLTGPCAVDKAAVLAGGEHIATWTTTTSCWIRLIDARIFKCLIEDSPALRDHILCYLSGQVRDARRARVQHATAPPVGQVAAWLSKSAQEHGARVVLPGAQHGLGEELGLSRISINRALQTLTRHGAVLIEPGVVTVLDTQRLAQFIRKD